MADDIKEELSMEEILSSIRNILMEDNVNQEEGKKAPPEELSKEAHIPEEDAEEILKLEDEIEDIADLNLDDEVLDLSTSMLVDDAEINLEAELIDVDSPEPKLPILEADFNLEETKAEEDIDTLLDEIEIDSLLNAAPPSPAKEDVVEEELSADTAPEEIIEELEEDLPQDSLNMDTALLDEILKAGEEAEKQEEPEEEVEEEREEKSITITALPMEEIAPKVPAKTEDASEKLLDSFAKVFSNDNQKGLKAELTEELRSWLGNNLPKLIQKEVERVMARAAQ